MDTMTSGRVFPRFCLFSQSRTFKTCHQKHAVILPASPLPAPSGQSSRDRSGRARCPFRPRAPLGSSRRVAAAGALPSALSGATRAAEALAARLQMSDSRAAEGPGFWGAAAGREPAGGIGDVPGVEGSQAAASGTQGRGAGGWAPPGLRARTSAPGSAALCRPGQPLRARSPSLGFCWGHAFGGRDRRPHHPLPGGGLRSTLFSTPVSKCLGSCPASFLRSARMVLTGLLRPASLQLLHTRRRALLGRGPQPPWPRCPRAWLPTRSHRCTLPFHAPLCPHPGRQPRLPCRIPLGSGLPARGPPPRLHPLHR